MSLPSCDPPDLSAGDFKRIETAIEGARRQERWVIALSVAIFLLGGAAIAWSLISATTWIAAPAVLAQVFLYWPIRQIIAIRRDNLALATIPVLIKTLPPEKAAAEVVKLLAELRR